MILLVWSASKQQSIMQFWRCNCGDDVIPRWGANIRALQYPIRCVIQCDSAWYDITAHHYRYYSVFLSDSERVGLTLGGRAYSWTSWMKNMLLLSGWCSMPAPLPDLCWPKLWWSIIGLLMSWAMEAASLLKRQKATPVNMHSANAWGWCRQFARQHGDESITGYCQGFASCTCSSTPRPVPICLHPAVTWQNLWDSYFSKTTFSHFVWYFSSKLLSFMSFRIVFYSVSCFFVLLHTCSCASCQVLGLGLTSWSHLPPLPATQEKVDAPWLCQCFCFCSQRPWVIWHLYKGVDFSYISWAAGCCSI